MTIGSRNAIRLSSNLLIAATSGCHRPNGTLAATVVRAFRIGSRKSLPFVMLGRLGFRSMLSLWRSAGVFTLSHPWPFGDDWFGVRTSNFPEGLFRGNINP